MKHNMFQMEFRGYSGYKLIRQRLRDFIQQVIGLECQSILVAINEAINNGLFHSCSDGQNKVVSVKITIIKNKRLIIRVKDNGAGFCAKDVLDKLANYDVDIMAGMDFNESGRGLFMMKKLTDYLKYNHKGNEVLLMKKIY